MGLSIVVALLLTACLGDDGGGASPAPPATDTTASARPTAPPTAPSTASTVPAGSMAELPEGDDVVVGTIVDGDTLRTSDQERVRLLNIDAPEVTGNECGASEATEALRALVPPGTEIRLVYDRERLDRYGRTLAHIYRRSDALWVNLELVEEGVARPYVLRPNDAHYDEIASAAGVAERSQLGLWGACERGSLQQTPTTIAVASDDPARAGCDAAYPTVCIPPAPPDLDCADVVFRRFTVLPPDPHHFDGGGDGIGCENG